MQRAQSELVLPGGGGERAARAPFKRGQSERGLEGTERGTRVPLKRGQSERGLEGAEPPGAGRERGGAAKDKRKRIVRGMSEPQLQTPPPRSRRL